MKIQVSAILEFPDEKYLFNPYEYKGEAKDLEITFYTAKAISDALKNGIKSPVRKKLKQILVKTDPTIHKLIVKLPKEVKKNVAKKSTTAKKSAPRKKSSKEV